MSQVMMTTIRVKYGRLSEFHDIFANQILPLMAQNTGQRLLASYQTVVGPSFHKVINIWEVDVANELVAVRQAETSPEWKAIYERLQSVLEDHGQELLIKTPFSP